LRGCARAGFTDVAIGLIRINPLGQDKTRPGQAAHFTTRAPTTAQGHRSMANGNVAKSLAEPSPQTTKQAVDRRNPFLRKQDRPNCFATGDDVGLLAPDFAGAGLAASRPLLSWSTLARRA